MDIKRSRGRIDEGTISSEELTKRCLARIANLDRSLNAFITVDGDSAVTQARQCDRLQRAGRVSSRLLGVPIALKDNIDTAGVKTTGAARVFNDRVPTADAEVTRPLKAARAVLLGKPAGEESVRMVARVVSEDAREGFKVPQATPAGAPVGTT